MGEPDSGAKDGDGGEEGKEVEESDEGVAWADHSLPGWILLWRLRLFIGMTLGFGDGDGDGDGILWIF